MATSTSTFPSPDIFQPIFDASQLEDAVAAQLKLWMPVYLREMEIQREFPSGDHLPQIRSFTTFSRIDRYDEQQMPGIVVFSPGTTGAPRIEGDGTYSATWNVGVTAFVSARDLKSTNQLAKQYAAAVRAITIQKPSQGGVAQFADWISETYDDIFLPEDERTVSTGTGFFEITVFEVLNRRGGPRTYPDIEPPDPDTQPGSQWPLAQKVIIDIIKKGLLE